MGASLKFLLSDWRVVRLACVLVALDILLIAVHGVKYIHKRVVLAGDHRLREVRRDRGLAITNVQGTPAAGLSRLGVGLHRRINR